MPHCCYDKEQNPEHSLKSVACLGPHLTLQSNFPLSWPLLSALQTIQQASFHFRVFHYFVLTLRTPLSSFPIQLHLAYSCPAPVLPLHRSSCHVMPPFFSFKAFNTVYHVCVITSVSPLDCPSRQGSILFCSPPTSQNKVQHRVVISKYSK